MKPLVIGGRELTTPCMVASAMAETADAMLQQAARAVALGADLVELRVDKLADDADVAIIVQETDCPHIIACRTPQFGGFFTGSEEARIARLEGAARAGATVVDIEYFTAPELRARLIETARACGMPVLIGYENMQETPDRQAMISGLHSVSELGPDLVKLAVRAHSYADLLTVLEVAHEAASFLEAPFAVIALGAHGAPSRPLACVLGASFTYCAMEQGAIPGQLTLQETREMVRLLEEQRWSCSSKS